MAGPSSALHGGPTDHVTEMLLYIFSVRPTTCSHANSCFNRIFSDSEAVGPELGVVGGVGSVAMQLGVDIFETLGIH